MSSSEVKSGLVTKIEELAAQTHQELPSQWASEYLDALANIEIVKTPRGIYQASIIPGTNIAYIEAVPGAKTEGRDVKRALEMRDLQKLLLQRNSDLVLIIEYNGLGVNYLDLSDVATKQGRGAMSDLAEMTNEEHVKGIYILGPNPNIIESAKLFFRWKVNLAVIHGFNGEDSFAQAITHLLASDTHP